MSPQILKEKAEKLLDYLHVLVKYKDISYNEFLAESHFIVERIVELLVTTSADILMHKMALIDESLPTTLRTTFIRAGELNWIPMDLAKNLANAAGMRNLLVHGYEKIDLQIIYQSIGPVLKDYTRFGEEIIKIL